MENTNRMGRLPINNESLTFLMEVSTFEEAVESLAIINTVTYQEALDELADEPYIYDCGKALKGWR